ncbi:MAG: hypothetical protein ACR2OV_03525 [Hyphomicrobiaceae bacterium]
MRPRRLNWPGLRCSTASALLISLFVSIGTASAQTFRSPDIFVLGDSQLAFGAGPAIFEFFQNFSENCSQYDNSDELTSDISMMRVGVMGVRSTSIHSWVSREWKYKKFVCQPDPKWQVNARLYGWPKRTDGTYVQLGRARGFRICKQKKSALEVMFKKSAPAPKLLLLFFTGNSVHRWANAHKLTVKDIRRLHQQMPASSACIIMTTVPTYRRKDNRLRMKSQIGLRRAIEAVGSRCIFIPGYNKKTVATFQNNRQYYRRRKSGSVKDPYHPNNPGARKFVALKRKGLCRATLNALRPHILADRAKARRMSQLIDPARTDNMLAVD